MKRVALKFKFTLASILMIAGILFLMVSASSVYAAPVDAVDNTVPSTGQQTGSCTGGGLSIPNCSSGQYKCDPNQSSTECLKNNPIILWINFFINLLAAVIGVGAVAMVIFAGIQYTAARDNPQAIQAAKQKITNVLIGLAGFIFLWAFLQWLIPGGVFS